MGFDVVHLNLHKTFATPHGGGGPGAGPVGVGERLLPFLPVPMVGERDGHYYWVTEKTRPQSIGRLSTFAGNVGVLLRAYVYARLVGREGMARIAQYAALNANYLMERLSRLGFEPAYRTRRAAHEFLLTLKGLKDKTGVTALDVAKRLLDKGYHAPTIYFPLMVPECLLIEPTETESRDELDGFVAAMAEILAEAKTTPELLKGAPYTLPVRRVDEVRAARELDLAWRPHPIEL
jgi:glycine dehydrogenase subunit 2